MLNPCKTSRKGSKTVNSVPNPYLFGQGSARPETRVPVSVVVFSWPREWGFMPGMPKPGISLKTTILDSFDSFRHHLRETPNVTIEP